VSGEAWEAGHVSILKDRRDGGNRHAALLGSYGCHGLRVTVSLCLCVTMSLCRCVSPGHCVTVLSPGTRCPCVCVTPEERRCDSSASCLTPASFAAQCFLSQTK